ncbi:hypothetical protein HG536_0B06430 [Torulaspora globosa]|uniref:Glucosamine 6-phosphate N-acetyltransferase n=1 Tax=Torulaspora globosa TaxID=48254 RepID=A0A7G3ZE39_9SACH|nr:uncharacterized protein HG536_0B06430 [Torulaspora globosa]QLL31775.1 hypothetical protein HG536_0B06430 [Torulaspora globosa]
MTAGYTIRRISKDDYEGVIDTLKVLTVVGDVSRRRFEEIVDHWDAVYLHGTSTRQYNPLVVVEDATGQIAATGNIILERKLIHDAGLCGHIEDIAVSKSHQGKRLGKFLIDRLTQLGFEAGCYKIILDCDPKNVPFYEKCGYSKAGIEMQIRRD